jgi:uncharacterized protein YjiS (DUF1127 family)
MSSMTIVSTGTSALSAMGATASRRVAAIGAWLRAQRDYRLLCQMEESALRDIGLTGSDLRDATAVGIFGDPTAIIAGRADERQARGRR